MGGKRVSDDEWLLRVGRALVGSGVSVTGHRRSADRRYLMVTLHCSVHGALKENRANKVAVVGYSCTRCQGDRLRLEPAQVVQRTQVAIEDGSRITGAHKHERSWLVHGICPWGHEWEASYRAVRCPKCSVGGSMVGRSRDFPDAPCLSYLSRSGDLVKPGCGTPRTKHPTLTMDRTCATAYQVEQDVMRLLPLCTPAEANQFVKRSAGWTEVRADPDGVAEALWYLGDLLVGAEWDG